MGHAHAFRGCALNAHTYASFVLTRQVHLPLPEHSLPLGLWTFAVVACCHSVLPVFLHLALPHLDVTHALRHACVAHAALGVVRAGLPLPRWTRLGDVEFVHFRTDARIWFH